MRTKFIYLLLFTLAHTISGQYTHSIFYKKNGKETNNIDKSDYYRKVINTGERFYFQEFLTESNQLVKETEIKSWKPLIEDGKTVYFDKISGQFIVQGYYQNGQMSDIWVYKTNSGYDTIDYSITEIQNLPYPSFSQKETYLFVDKMPFFNYGEDLKQKREALDKKIADLKALGKIKTNHEEYMDLQRQILDINKQAFDRYKANDLIYPIRAKEKAIHGTVYLQFVIDEFGKIVETVILRGVDIDLDKEAIRLVNAMSEWTVGTQNGVPARVSMTVGVSF